MNDLLMGELTISQTLDRGIKLYKQTIKKVLIFIGLPGLLALMNYRALLTPPDQEHPWAFLNGWSILSMFIGFWTLLVSIRYIHQSSLGKTMEFGEIIKLARPVDMAVIVAEIIWTAALFLGFLLLIIPGVYLMNIGMIGVVVVIIEKKYFFNSIGRSFKLTQGRWWKTFVINVLSGLIVGIPYMIGLMIFMGPTYMKALSSPSLAASMEPVPEITAMNMIGLIVSLVINAVAFPLLIAINVAHYNSLRSEKAYAAIDHQVDAGQASSPGSV